MGAEHKHVYYFCAPDCLLVNTIMATYET